MKNSLMVDKINDCTEVNLHNPALLQFHQHHLLAVYGTHTQEHYEYPDPSDKQTLWLEEHCFQQIIQDEPTPDADYFRQ